MESISTHNKWFFALGHVKAWLHNRFAKERANNNLLLSPPVFTVEVNSDKQHTLRFDGAAMLNGKTRSGYACEIWAMIDDEMGFTYLATENKSPYTVVFTNSVNGKTVKYRLRWVTNEGGTGPWSGTIGNTVV